MTRVILWKEFREQASILLALLMLGSGIVITAAVLGSLSPLSDPFEFRGYSDPARIALVMLVMVGGLVCGSMLFANEHENGTADFLHYLPANRHRLWWAKFAAAITLTSVLSLLFSIVGLAVGIFPIQALLAWTLWLLILAVAAMASGMFGSSITKLVLAACGIGMIAGPTLANIGAVAIVLATRFLNNSYGYFGYEVYRPTLAIAVGPLVAVGGMLMLSYVGFVRPDWRRKRTTRGATVLSETKRIAAAIPKPVSRFGVRALAWLSHRQWWIPGIVLFSLATVFGLILAIREVPMVFLWPAASAILGVFAGVCAFAPEQMSNVQRYWAEQRLPVGRLWTVKVVHALVMLGSAMLLLGTPPLVTAIVNKTFREFSGLPTGYFRSMLIDGEGPVLAMVFLWPAYAFVASLVAGQCFRKPVVSLAVGGMIGMSLAALWIPSLLSGGLMHWQLWPAPIAALIGSRWLMPEWTRGQIASRSGLTKLTMTIVAVLTLVGGSIAYRWIEVPVVPEIEEDIEFAQSIPVKDDKNAGQEVRRILGSFKPIDEELRKRPAMKIDKDRDRFRGSPIRTRTPPFTETVSMQLSSILKTGYPPDRPDFDDYFTELNKRLAITEDWIAIRDKPTGVAFDPRDYNLIAFLPEVQDSREFFLTMATRGLREQALGRPDVFLDDVESLLAMARTMRSKTFSIVSLTMTAMEGVVAAAIPRWLERLGHDPRRLARLQSILARHESEPAESQRTFHLAMMVTMRNSIRDPQGWHVKSETIGMGDKPQSGKEQRETEANLLQFAWNVPWEKERLRRAFGLANAPNSPPGWTLKNAYRRLAGQTLLPGKTPEECIEGLPGFSTLSQLFSSGRSPTWLRDIGGPIRPEIEQRRQAQLRAIQTLVALRRFEAVRGRLPARLDELVPDYLPAVPMDPFSRKPFRYERVDGQERYVFLNQRPEPRPVPGTDIEPALERDEWNGIAAALGSIVQFPKPPEPVFPPGFDPNRGMEEGATESLPVLFGGLVLWPLGYDRSDRPGVEGGAGQSPGGPGGGDFITPAKPITIAGMGGVGAASLPWQVDQEAFGEESNPLVRFTANLEATPVAKGRGILWSVGNDLIDDRGIWQMGLGSIRGDMIWIVPSAANK